MIHGLNASMLRARALPMIIRFHGILSCCVLYLVLTTARADTPSFPLEGGQSVIGTEFSKNGRTPAAFGEVVWGENYIGHSQCTWAPDVIGGWVDGRQWIRDPVPGYPARDHIWLMGAGIRVHYGRSDAWYRPLFFSFQPSLHTGRTRR